MCLTPQPLPGPRTYPACPRPTFASAAPTGFRDENIIYAMRLYDAGVPTELHVYPGAPHGVGLFPQTQIAHRYTADKEDWLHRQLERIG